MSDRIFVRGLCLHAYHGVMPHEAEVGQSFSIDLVLDIDLAASARSDKVADTVSYDQIVKVASDAFTGRRYKLIEAAAGATADAILKQFDAIKSLRVTVHKPHAPIAAIFADVGVELFPVALVPQSLLALGGNVGEVRANLLRAVRKLCRDHSVKLVARSSDYRTAAWGVTDQPAFVNLCIAVETSLGPLDLLDRALGVEREMGRERSREQRWGPRTVDIDLLTYDDLVFNDPRLTLPHPRMFERAFVLVPLADIAPDKVIGGRRVRDALADIDATGIERLPPRA